MRCVRERNNKNVAFLFENVAGMELKVRDTINKTFGVEPILLPGEIFSASRRNRLWWTNLPQRISDSKEFAQSFPSITLDRILRYPAAATEPWSRCVTRSNGSEKWVGSGAETISETRHINNQSGSNLVLQNVNEPSSFRNFLMDEVESVLGLYPGCTRAIATSRSKDHIRRWRLAGAVFLPAAVMFLLRTLRDRFLRAPRNEEYPYAVVIDGGRNRWYPGIGIECSDIDAHRSVSKTTEEDVETVESPSPENPISTSNSRDDRARRWCVCGLPNDGNVYVACARGDECLVHGWLHPECCGIGRGPHVERLLPDWICPVCEYDRLIAGAPASCKTPPRRVGDSREVSLSPPLKRPRREIEKPSEGAVRKSRGVGVECECAEGGAGSK